MTELLNCPFCGGSVSFHKDEECPGCHLIQCGQCRAFFDFATGADPGNDCESVDALRSAIAPMWNRRAQPAEAEGVEVRCDICGGTGAADSGGIQPWGEAIYVDCECIAKQEQFAGKLGALKKAAKGACSYSEDDWFRPENLWSCMEKDDAAFVSAASPFALLALIAAYERISAALSAVTAERDKLRAEVERWKRTAAAGVENELVLVEQRTQLRAEVEALRPDAERYRWLRGRLPGSAYRIAGVIYSEGGEGVDAAVDVAMAAKEG